jgi:hypothetical protein
MQDVQEMLRTLPHAVTPRPAGADVVAADVARGHHALSRQRRRRFAGLGGAVAVVAAVAVTVTSQPAQPGRPAPSAADRSTATAQTPKIQLAAYTGEQPVGFIVSTVPTGWRIYSSDDYSFVVAPPGATTAPAPAVPADAQDQAKAKAAAAAKAGHKVSQGVSFVGKIAVMLQGMSELPSGSQPTQVTINGKEGQLGFAEGGTGAARVEWLIFPDSAGHKVLVQVPASLGLTQAQIVSFAQGITVTKAAKAAAG